MSAKGIYYVQGVLTAYKAPHLFFPFLSVKRFRRPHPEFGVHRRTYPEVR